jgi:hypothetical protein
VYPASVSKILYVSARSHVLLLAFSILTKSNSCCVPLLLTESFFSLQQCFGDLLQNEKKKLPIPGAFCFISFHFNRNPYMPMNQSIESLDFLIESQMYELEIIEKIEICHTTSLTIRT